MATLNTPRSKDSYKNRTVRRPLISETSSSSRTESVKHSINRINITDENHESVIFIWFDPHEQSNINLVGPLRAINDSVQAYTDSSSCFDTIRTSKEKVFFICSTNNNALIATVHDFSAVEAIFILDSNADGIKGDFPKLFGVFSQQEELFRILKEVFDAFEQIQLEEFAFEQDKIFLWSQLWKEELIGRRVLPNKQEFIEMARHYYRDNTRIIELIVEFEKSYRPAEVINWCFRSPFPTRFLLHALRSHSKAQLSVFRFIFADASRSFQQQSKRKTGDQVYRGMKLSSDLLDQFEARIGQLICTSGFFPCTKSRTNALASASLSTYRPDLLSVFFKIDCDASSLCTEVSNKNSSSLIVFDVCMAFRIVYVNRGQMSIIKMKTAGDAGKKIALDYLEKHKDETIQSMLDELLRPPKPPTPPPPPRIPTPPPPPRILTPPPPRILTPPPPPPVEINVSTDSILAVEENKAQKYVEENKAQKYVEEGDIDLALVAYQRIQPVTARVLNVIGHLCADKKGDYDYALQCHKQALEIQEKSGEDISETLTYIGNIYQSRCEYDLALYYHKQALELRQAIPTTEFVAIVSSLLGIANAHRARSEYSEAIVNAERALALQKALVPPDETNVAATLALLGNIYQDSGDTAHALDLCTEALTIFECTISPDSLVLAELLYNLGRIQSSSEALSDAQHSFERSINIYREFLPSGHEDRVLVENEFQRIIELRQKDKENSGQQ